MKEWKCGKIGHLVLTGIPIESSLLCLSIWKIYPEITIPIYYLHSDLSIGTNKANEKYVFFSLYAAKVPEQPKRIHLNIIK